MENFPSDWRKKDKKEQVQTILGWDWSVHSNATWDAFLPMSLIK